MNVLAPISLLVLTPIFALSAAPPVVELRRENCTDPNAEYRGENPGCVLTCDKKTITENPVSCFKAPKLTAGCYCKQNFVLNEKTKKCVKPENCPCDSNKMEQSRFSSDCANSCDTYNSRKCATTLHMDCYCMFTYCKASNGTCVSKQ